MSFLSYIVKVLFNDFLLEEGYPCDDVLTFYDGMNETSSLLGSYCGTIHPEVIYSTGQYLHVKFGTDNMVNYKGFSLSLTAVKKGTVLQCFIHCNVYRELVSVSIVIELLSAQRTRYSNSLHVLQALYAKYSSCLHALQAYDAINSRFLHALQTCDTSQSSPVYTLQAYDDSYSD